MAAPDIARVVARAVLAAELDDVNVQLQPGDAGYTDLKPVIDALLSRALSVKRSRTRAGEIVTLTYGVPPDPTEPEA